MIHSFQKITEVS